MEEKIKIAVIGGTGKSGKYLLKALLQQGFSIKLLLRNPDNFQTDNLLIEIVKGDARNGDAISTLLAGCHAVISTIGQPVGETSIFSEATENVLAAMHQHGIGRYLLITGLNVDTPEDEKGPKTRFGTEWMKTNYPKTTLDKQVEYEILTKSDVDWTLLRLPMIHQTDDRGEVLVDLKDCPGDKINASDLADFLISQLTDETYIRAAPFIATA